MNFWYAHGFINIEPSNGIRKMSNDKINTFPLQDCN